MKSRIAVLISSLVLLVGVLPASAEPIDATIALTLNALSGQHLVGGGRSDRVTLAPIPLGELVLRHGDEGVRIEGLPSVRFGLSGANGDGAQSTALSILNATYRHAFTGGWFVGVGQTVYNQSTTYQQTIAFFTAEQQYSRVTGLRYELGRTFTTGLRSKAEVWLTANPAMHGVQYTRLPSFGARFAAPIVADPESATQVDIESRVTTRLSARGELLYGARYINYVARYDRNPGLLADRNVGIAPVLGYRYRIYACADSGRLSSTANSASP